MKDFLTNLGVIVVTAIRQLLLAVVSAMAPCFLAMELTNCGVPIAYTILIALICAILFNYLFRKIWPNRGYLEP